MMGNFFAKLIYNCMMANDTKMMTDIITEFVSLCSLTMNDITAMFPDRYELENGSVSHYQYSWKSIKLICFRGDLGTGSLANISADRGKFIFRIIYKDSSNPAPYVDFDFD